MFPVVANYRRYSPIGLLVCSALSASTVVAGSGDPDLNFGTNGLVTTQVGVANSSLYCGKECARSVVVQPDGKIVAAGYAYNGSNHDFALVRYNANGSLDATFGAGTGKVMAPIYSQTSGDAAFGVALQPDGKLIVVGVSVLRMAVTRFNADGILDTSFGTAGKVVSSTMSSSRAVAIQGDNKIVVVGEDFYKGMLLLRLNADGSKDVTFGGGSGYVTPLNTNGNQAYAVAIQRDGRLVVAGSVWNGHAPDTAIVRLLSDGSMDTSFGGGDGVVITPAGTEWDEANAVVMQPDGKIVVAGYANSNGPTGHNFAVIRYTATGGLDPEFGDGDGIALHHWNNTLERGEGVALQADGKLVVAGTWGLGATVMRLLPNGALDPTFGGGQGWVAPAMSATRNSLYATTLQVDGKIVAVGGAQVGYPGQFAAVRLQNTIDDAPTPFRFSDKVDVLPGTLVTSASIKLAGLTGTAAISVSGGEVRINNGAWSASGGIVSNGAAVTVRHRAASGNAAATHTWLTMGGVADVFSSITVAADDAVPRSFVLADQIGVTPSSQAISKKVVVNGFAVPASISVSGGEYSVGCTTAFTSAPGTLAPGKAVCVRHTAGGAPHEPKNTLLTVGGVVDVFTSVTAGLPPAIDTVPSVLGFADQFDVPVSASVVSNVVAIGSINAPSAISVAGGEYRINSGAWTSVAGTVKNGDKVTVRHTAAASFGAAETTLLNVGGVVEAFTTSTARSNDANPELLPAFGDVTAVSKNAVRVSSAIRPTGFAAAAPVHVTNGEFSIGCNTLFTSADSYITPNQTICVRHTSAGTSNTAVNTVLDVGGMTEVFTSVTAP